MSRLNETQPGPVLEFLGRVAFELHLMRPLLPTYTTLLVSAIFPIYTAAHASLVRPISAAPAPRKRKRSAAYDEDEQPDPKIEALTPSDAILFPVLAGTTLASLYFILKWLQDPAWLNWILGIYFSQVGLFFMVKFLQDLFSVSRSIVFPRSYSSKDLIWVARPKEACFRSTTDLQKTTPFPGPFRVLPLPQKLTQVTWKFYRFLYAKADLSLHLHGLITVKTYADALDLLSLVLSCGLIYCHTFIAKPWYLTNIIGFAFCYGSLQYMTPTTAWTATLILGALFFYDIYFVFFTPMMVTVATKLDVPIKLLFPRPDGCIKPIGAPEGSAAMQEYLECISKKRAMAMLGLGDIVVPGIMLAFALRFDLFLFYLRQNRESKEKIADKGSSSTMTKPIYLPAAGSWGERFWTKHSLQSSRLKAKNFPKPYFHATILGYTFGMVATLIAMQVTQHAQPALLYLVPGVLTSLWGTAFFKGDIKTLWDYTEMPENESKEKLKAEKDSKDQNNGDIKDVPPDQVQPKRLTNSTSEDLDNDKSAIEIENPKHSSSDKDTPADPISKPISHEKQCRNLFNLTIGLPKLPQFELADELFIDDTNSKKTSLIESNGTADLVEDSNSSTTNANAIDRTSGEPPEKRRRRS